VQYELDEFTGLLERRISDSIKGVSAHSWNEDYITFKLLSELNSTLSSVDLEGKNFRQSIEWESYKLRGSYETNFGDIAIIVNISYRDGTGLEGVAFLEAKRRDWRKTTFSAMNKTQLKRILRHAPRAHYLLYDYEGIIGFSNPVSFGREVSRYRRSYWPGLLTEKTSSLCVPLNVAGATGFKDTLLYRHGTPLAWMLSNRYFQGLDLEFDDTAKSVATGFLNKFGLPKFVMRVEVTEQGAEPRENQLQLNFEEYEKLEQ
jgi:hypothetical protein